MCVTEQHRFNALSIWRDVSAYAFILPLLLLSACSTLPSLPANTPASYVSTPISCVPYAREVSGIQIFGDAHTWWNKASPRYQRGQIPLPGSVLVLDRTSKMTSGHVATVARVMGPRHITVNHSNWGNNSGRRKVIYHAMPVEDISPNNDWTSVKFWNYEMGVYGFPYKSLGFIYKN